MLSKLISVDFKAQFGFLKKPDNNKNIYFTYNCLHKPALLGMLGAIIGLGGYSEAYLNKEDFPEYYQKLKDIKVGIIPLSSMKGIFQKIVIYYNNSVGYASKEEGNILQIKEQVLLKPSYRIFILLNIEEEIELQIYNNLKSGESVYIPYLGKNEFQVWWDNFTEYEYEPFKATKDYKISSLFLDKEEKKLDLKDEDFDLDSILNAKEEDLDIFTYVERLPLEYNIETKNYNKYVFVFTDNTFKKEFKVNNLYLLKNTNQIIQLF